MNKEDKDYVLSKIHNESFDYCFDGYSSWGSIEDEKFQELKQNYLKAKQGLQNYLAAEDENKERNPLEITPEEFDQLRTFIVKESKKQSFWRRQYNKFLGLKYQLQDFLNE